MTCRDKGEDRSMDKGKGQGIVLNCYNQNHKVRLLGGLSFSIKLLFLTNERETQCLLPHT